MFSTPAMSKRAYGISSGRANCSATFCSSTPSSGILTTPGDTSRLTIGHRRSVAITTMLGSGLTTTGWPTADEQRGVEHAVGVGVALGEVDAVLRRPLRARR